MLRIKFIKYLRILLGICFFALCIYLIIIGQRMIGYFGLGLMILGLVGLLLMLYSYNQRYIKK